MKLNSQFITDEALANSPLTFATVDGGDGIGMELRVTVLGQTFPVARPDPKNPGKYLGAVPAALIAAGLDPADVAVFLDAIRQAARTAADLDPPADEAALTASLADLKATVAPALKGAAIVG